MMDAKQVVAALEQGYGHISKDKFPESELPEAVRELINEAYQHGYNQGSSEAWDAAQQEENARWD